MDADSRSLRALVEAAIFASPEPVTIRQLARALTADETAVLQAIEEIRTEHSGPEHGVFVREVRGGYQLGIKPEHKEALHEVLRGLRPRAPLSLAALQTLAIVAYRQPISAPAIQAIRRVEGAGVLQTLLKRQLIAAAGHSKDAGRALRYKTTRQFLVDFGLKDLSELPELQEFAELREQCARTSSFMAT